MEQNPSWKANKSLASKEFPYSWWNPSFRYRIHNSRSPVPILNQISPVPNSPSHFLYIYFNIIIPSTSVSSKWPPSLRLSHQNPVCNSPLYRTYYMPRPFYSSWFHHLNNIWWVYIYIYIYIYISLGSSLCTAGHTNSSYIFNIFCIIIFWSMSKYLESSLPF